MFPVPEELLSIFFNNFSAFPVCYRPLLQGTLSLSNSAFSTAHFTGNTFKVLLCRLTYSVPTSFLHPGRRWCTVSLLSSHNLYFPHSSNPLIFFHALVSIICSCNVNIDDVFLGTSRLHFNQPESSWIFNCLGISLWIYFSAKLCLFLFFP